MSENNLEALMGRVLGNELQRGLELKQTRSRNWHKARKPAKRIRKATKKPLGVLKRKLDVAFSAMIMERDRDLLCISCRKNPGTQAGHFMRRGLMATRWHPENVRAQCFRCNCVESGNQLEYAETLDSLLAGTSDRLRALAKTSYKPSREALEALLATAKVGHEAYQETWNFYGSEK